MSSPHRSATCAGAGCFDARLPRSRCGRRAQSSRTCWWCRPPTGARSTRCIPDGPGAGVENGCSVIRRDRTKGLSAAADYQGRILARRHGLLPRRPRRVLVAQVPTRGVLDAVRAQLPDLLPSLCAPPSWPRRWWTGWCGERLCRAGGLSCRPPGGEDQMPGWNVMAVKARRWMSCGFVTVAALAIGVHPGSEPVPRGLSQHHSACWRHGRRVRRCSGQTTETDGSTRLCSDTGTGFTIMGSGRTTPPWCPTDLHGTMNRVSFGWAGFDVELGQNKFEYGTIELTNGSGTEVGEIAPFERLERVSHRAGRLSRSLQSVAAWSHKDAPRITRYADVGAGIRAEEHRRRPCAGIHGAQSYRL